MKMISQSMGQYLLQIGLLQSECSEAHVTDIARSLDVSKPSVCRAVRHLAEAGYIYHDAYGPIKLATNGKQVVIELQERELSIQVFLTEVLGVEQEHAKKQSRLWAYVISDDTVDRMRQALRWEATA